MAKIGDPEAQQAWENLYRLIMMCPDPEGWGFREKLVEASKIHGEAMRSWGFSQGWNDQDNYGREDA